MKLLKTLSCAAVKSTCPGCRLLRTQATLRAFFRRTLFQRVELAKFAVVSTTRRITDGYIYVSRRVFSETSYRMAL